MDVSPSPVPWTKIATFVLQLSHDLRNDLNALSLEAALLKEFVTDPDAVTSANRIQSQLRDIAQRLKDLSGRFILPAANPSVISINELAAELQRATGSISIEWLETEGTGSVNTDPALLSRAFVELATNAAERGKGGAKPQARLRATSSEAVLILREPGTPSYEWPETPFAAVRGGHYGIGLPIAAAILRGLGAQIDRANEDDWFETRITLPVAS
jgi:K+-sensing histidine kinase KdpD